jgi:leader peptidase (prepilin peptidase)/N-methyltransferase
LFEAIISVPFFLCWGSFLNVVGYRLIHEKSFIYPRSHCTHCKHTLAWYDLIPVISYLMLKGKCRYCHKSISFLYPLIELITAVIMPLLLLRVDSLYFPSYFIFFSALIVTIRTDLDLMLISRFVTLFLVPLAFILSFFSLLFISPLESFLGAFFGYGILFFIDSIFKLITKKTGIGQGDLDLLSFIGSFTGIYGAWFSLMFGSIIGSAIAGAYMLITKQTQGFKIPFGPFLGLGAMMYVLYHEEILRIIFKAYNF